MSCEQARQNNACLGITSQWAMARCAFSYRVCARRVSRLRNKGRSAALSSTMRDGNACLGLCGMEKVTDRSTLPRHVLCYAVLRKASLGQISTCAPPRPVALASRTPHHHHNHHRLSQHEPASLPACSSRDTSSRKRHGPGPAQRERTCRQKSGEEPISCSHPRLARSFPSLKTSDHCFERRERWKKCASNHFFILDVDGDDEMWFVRWAYTCDACTAWHHLIHERASEGVLVNTTSALCVRQSHKGA